MKSFLAFYFLIALIRFANSEVESSGIFSYPKEGLRLEKIGNVKMIGEYTTISWAIDINNMKKWKKQIEKEIQFTKKSVCVSSYCAERMDILYDNLEVNEQIFDNILESSSLGVSRSKRYAGITVYNNYYPGLGESYDHSDLEAKMTKNSKVLNILDKKISEIQQKISVNSKIQKIENDVQSFENTVKLLSVRHSTNKYAGSIELAVAKLQSKFDSIKVTPGLEICLNLNESLKLSKISTEVSKEKIKFSLKIPLCEEVSSLYKVIAIPAKINNTVVVLNIESDYAALEGDYVDAKLIKSLKQCIELPDGTFLCDYNSKNDEKPLNLPIMNFMGISMISEKVFGANLPDISVIELKHGKFWFNLDFPYVDLPCKDDFPKSAAGNGVYDSEICIIIEPQDDEGDSVLHYYYNVFSEELDGVKLPTLINNKTYNLDEFFATAGNLYQNSIESRAAMETSESFLRELQTGSIPQEFFIPYILAIGFLVGVGIILVYCRKASKESEYMKTSGDLVK